jgi:deoxyribose-phosphate aldolase
MEPEPPKPAGRSSNALLATAIEHTCLRADATAPDIERLCQEALEYQFHCVCVNGSRIVQAVALLEDSPVKVAATVGFPLGAMDSDSKRFETEAAIDGGAQEIDVVLNIGRLKDGDSAYVLRELRDVAEAAEERPVKVILETCLLTREEKILACRLVLDSGAHFVKTSTGLSTGGATVEDVRLVRETVGAHFGVKAAGGIGTAEQAFALLRAGANRLGTSSGVAIMRQAREDGRLAGQTAGGTPKGNT